MRTLRLVIEYDGTDFAGWQRQLAQRTVQGCLEDAFLAMTGEKVHVQGASRTDAGVHAEGQTASVRIEAAIPLPGLLRGLNAKLPPDVAIVDLADMPDDFNARRSARGKVYRYRIWNHFVRSPLHARTTWHVRSPLDVAAMRRAASVFVGVHDFAAFRAADCGRLTTVRLLRQFDVDREGPMVTCEIEGTAFLRNMVRILVGTLVSVGWGDLDEDGVRAVLAGRDRTKAGATAPARGLTLMRVSY